MERRQHFRWNMIFLRLYLGIWGVGMGFVGVLTILPVFMARAGLSRLLIGMIPAAQSFGSLLQPVAAHASAGLAKKKGQMLWFHVPYLGMGFVLAAGSFFVGTGREVYAGILVLSTVAICALSVGLVNPLWFELAAKLVPQGKRGGFFGVNNAVTSASGVMGAFLAKHVLDRWQFPTNFGVSFLCGAVLLSLATASLLPAREPASPEATRRPRFRDFMLRLFREANFDRNYRNFLIERNLAGIGYMSVGFLTVYTVHRFRLPSSAAASYSMVMMSAVMLTAVFWGRLGERIGYRSLSLIGLCLWTGGLVWAMVAPSAGWVGITFFVVGMAQFMDFVGCINIVLECCRRMEKAGFVAITNLLVIPGFVVGPVLGGFIAQRVSYEAMFWLAIGALALSVGILGFFFTDPRRLERAGRGKAEQGGAFPLSSAGGDF